VVEAAEPGYFDPETGFFVFTEAVARAGVLRERMRHPVPTPNPSS
jgi:hypothetical protein